jgi:hypothetical protein
VSLGHTPQTRVAFGGTAMSRGLCCVLVGNDLYMTRWLKLGPLSIPNSCGYDTGGLRSRSSKSDDHSTAHGHVLSRVVSHLIRISVFPFVLGVLTSSLNNKSASERESQHNLLIYVIYANLCYVIYVMFNIKPIYECLCSCTVLHLSKLMTYRWFGLLEKEWPFKKVNNT